MKSRLVPGGTLREFVIRTQLIRDESEQQDARAQAASPHPLPAHLVVRIASRYCTSSIPPTAESRFCVEINLESLWGVPLLAMGSGGLPSSECHVYICKRNNFRCCCSYERKD